MDILRETRQLRLSAQRAGLRFVRAELDLAITFSRIALKSDDPRKALRNLENAGRARASAQRFLERLHALGQELDPEIQEKMSVATSLVVKAQRTCSTPT